MLELDHKCLEFQDHKYVSWHYLFEKKLCFNRGTRGTFSVKFRSYMHHTTIFRGVLGNSPTYFYKIYILKPPYINYNPSFHIISKLIIWIKWTLCFNQLPYNFYPTTNILHLIFLLMNFLLFCTSVHHKVSKKLWKYLVRYFHSCTCANIHHGWHNGHVVPKQIFIVVFFLLYIVLITSISYSYV
jgi:hypothetical protein